MVGLVVTGNTELPEVGRTSQLTATAEMSTGDRTDVSLQVTWTTFPGAVATISASGLLTARAPGVASFTATLFGHRATGNILVTPPGTFAATGRTREPGSGGLGGVDIAGDSGQTAVSFSDGTFAIGGLTTPRLTFAKPGYESATLDIAPNRMDNDRPMQPMMRIAAGETVSGTVAPNDLSYDISADARCASCRRVRIVNAEPSLLRLQLTWGTTTRVNVSLWIEGQQILGSGQEIVTTLPVGAGELIVYVAADVGNDYFNFKLTTTVNPGGS